MGPRSSPVRRRRAGRLVRSLGLLACLAAIAACGSGAPRATSSSGPGSPGVSPAALPSGDWPVFGYDDSHSGSAPASGIAAADADRLRLRRVTIDTVGDSAAIEPHAVAVRGGSSTSSRSPPDASCGRARSPATPRTRRSPRR